MLEPRRLLAFALAATAMAACKRDAQRGSLPTDTAVGTPQQAAQSAPGAQPSPGAAVKPDYVGLQYDSLPKDFRLHAGAVLPRAAGGAEYDVSHVATPVGDEIWLDTLGAPVGKGLRARIVRAEMRVPPLAADERLFMASCDVNGKFDPYVVAIVVNEPGASRFTRIRQAWRANIAQSRFDVLPVAGVVCEEPGG